MGERMCQRTVTELSSYPTELEAHVTLTDQRRIRHTSLGVSELVFACRRSWKSAVP